MLALLVVAGIIVYVFAVPSPPKPTPAPVVVEHHHHYHVKVERNVYVDAQVQLIQAKIGLAQQRMQPEPARLPEARLHLNPSTAIERYRSHERKPS